LAPAKVSLDNGLISTIKIAGPPSAGTQAVSGGRSPQISPRRNAKTSNGPQPKRRGRRGSVPLLFSLEGLDEGPANAISSHTDGNTSADTTSVGEEAPVATSDAPTVAAPPVTVNSQAIISAIKIDAGPPAAPTFPPSATESVVINVTHAPAGKPTSNEPATFPGQSDTVLLAGRPTTPSEPTRQFLPSDPPPHPARPPRRRSGPMLFRPRLECLEDRLAPANIPPITVDTNWSAITGGSGTGGAPNASDTITVEKGATLTVDVATAAVGTLTIGSHSGGAANRGNGILLFNAGAQVTVSTSVDLGGTGGETATITMTSGGTLITPQFHVTAGAGAITFTGGTGTIELTADNALPAALASFNNLIVDSGTTTTLGASTAVHTITGAGAVTDNGTAQTFTVNNSTADTFAGTFTGTNLSLADTGSNTLALNAASTYSGTTTISSGATIADGIANALPTATDLTNSGTLDLAGFSQQLGSITGAGTITDSSTAAALTLNDSGADSYTGLISGSGLALTFSGSGTLTLSHNNTYAGTTTVTAGTLIINGTQSSSAVSVSGTGTLGGAGTVKSITASSGGTIDPATAGTTGTLTTAASSSSTLSGTFQVDLDDTKTPTSDQLAIGNSGTITLGGTLSVNVVNSAVGNVFTIVSSTSGGISGTFTGLADKGTFTATDTNGQTHTFQIHYTSTAVTLTDAQAPSFASATGGTTFTIGQNGTFNITTSGGTPTPTLSETGSLPSGVSFLDNGNGTATLSGTPALGSLSSYTLTIIASNGVSPDATQTFTLTVNPATTTTTAVNQTAVFGSSSQNVTLSATVTAGGSAGPVNEGFVTFAVFNGATQIGASVDSLTVSNGNASVTYVLPANTAHGVYSIHATYNPGTDYATSSDTTHTLTVSQASTSTAATSQTAVFGSSNQSVTLSAVVTATSGAGLVNEGTVTFKVFDSTNTQIGSSATSGIVNGGNASATFTLPGGTIAAIYTIQAIYNPGSDYTGSSDMTGTHTLTVNQATTSTAAVNQTAVFGSASQNVTLSAVVTATSGSGSVNEGTVTFTVVNGGFVQIGSQVTSGTVSGGNASATFVLPANTLNGTYFIHATYNPGSDYTGSSDNVNDHTLTVNLAGTTTTASNQTAVFDSNSQNVTLSAVVSATGGAGLVNGGTVTFAVLDSSSNPVGLAVNGNVLGGSASATYVLPGGTLSGTYTIQATYNAGTGYIGSTDTTHTLTVNKVGTTTTAANQAAPFQPFLQPITLSATVAPTSGSGSINEGTVTFAVFQGLTQIGSSTTSGTVSGGNASATFLAPSGMASGSYTIQATYNPGADYTTSSDNTHTLTVIPPTAFPPFQPLPTITIANSQSATFSSSGQNVTLQATVFTPFGDSTAVNEGTVTFTVSGLLGAPAISGVVSGGNATATYVLPGGSPSGIYAIVATYSGGPDYFPSGDSSQVLTVKQATTKTTVVSSAPSPPGSVFGQSVMFTATVIDASPGTGTPTGTVNFFDGLNLIGSGTLSAIPGNDQATFTTSNLALGGHSITATYVGDSNFVTSTSPAISQSVNKADTTTTVTSDVHPSVFGQTVTFTATVSSVAPGSGAPGGTLNFFDGSNLLGSGTFSGTVGANQSTFTFTTSGLSVGSHTIKASFTDTDGNFNDSNTVRPFFQQRVNPDSTTTVVTLASLPPAVAGQPLTFTAKVTADPPGGTPGSPPGGTVSFFLDGSTTAFDSQTLAGGQATSTAITIDVSGPHTITASFTDTDGNFTDSTSADLNLTVDPAAASQLAFITQPTTTAAGQFINPGTGVVVQLKDQFGNVATTDTSRVTLTPAGGTAGAGLFGTNPVTVSNGLATFSDLSINLKGTGYELVASDTNPKLADTSTAFDITAAATSQLVVAPAPGFSTVTFAGPYSFTVTAEDPFGNITPGFAGLVHFTSASEPPDVMPADSFLTNGFGTFTGELNFAGNNGNNSIKATDAFNPSINGTLNVHVNTQPTFLLQTTLIVPDVASVPAGTSLTIRVTAFTAAGTPNTNFTNAIHFVSTDPQAVLPADYTFTIGTAGDNGVHDFTGVILKTSGFQGPGPQTITAIDGRSAVQGVTITVSPLLANHLGILYPAVIVQNTPATLTIRALDPFGNIDPTYTGNVTLGFSYAGSQAGSGIALPAPFTFTTGTGADNGTRSFPLTLPAVGSYTIFGSGPNQNRDVPGATITGSSIFLVVSPPPIPVPAPNPTPGVDPNILALESLLNQNNRGVLSATTIVVPTAQATIFQVNNRDVISAPSNAPISVDTEAGGPNPALGLIAPTSATSMQTGDLAGADDFFLDGDLLPVMAARSRSGEAGGMDRILWPAAALLSFTEGGVWTVIATFLPDRATGQSNPPSQESGQGTPGPNQSSELEEILRQRSAPPKTRPPVRNIDPNAGSYLGPTHDGSLTVAAREWDGVPTEVAAGLLENSEPAEKNSKQVARAEFFVGLSGSEATVSPWGSTDSAAGSAPRDWIWFVAAAVFAVGMTGFHPWHNDPEEGKLRIG
jgi:autotransporter-associated beta strand protein